MQCKDVKEGHTLAVPEHLRTSSRKKLAAQIPALSEDASASTTTRTITRATTPLRPTFRMDVSCYYTPTENGLEKRIKERLAYWQELI